MFFNLFTVDEKKHRELKERKKKKGGNNATSRKIECTAGYQIVD